MNTPPQDDFRPSAGWPALRLRAELLRRVREFFYQRQFLEVETPVLSADIVVDRHLDPFATTFFPHADVRAGGRRCWLQTSPEFAMKRLMAAGAEAIYQIAHVFRQSEVGRLHNPEFTMVEWYRRGDGLAAGMKLLSELCEVLLERGPAEQLTYRDAFLRHAEIDPHRVSGMMFQAAALKHGIVPPASLALDDIDGWRDLLLVELVEPHLGRGRPTILFDYPASQSALAKVRADDPPVAERFELYADSIELANGYHELQDAAILRTRNRQVNDQRAADLKPRLPESSRLLTAMDHGLPDCAGVALGFDRVVMLAAGARSVADVMAFPIDRA
jgi:lysyl-tRNA synthetase class 2